MITEGMSIDELLFLLLTEQVSERELAQHIDEDTISEMEDRILEIVAARKNSTWLPASESVH